MRWWVALLLPMLGGCDLVLLGDECPVIEEPVGPFKRLITLSPTTPFKLEDFAVSVVTDGDPDLKAHARTDGADIAFTLLDGTLLPFERVAYADGSLEAWVRLTVEKQTQFLMVYGGIVVPFMREQVWANDAIAVYHLAEGDARAEDSTRNGNHLNPVDNRVPAPATGQVGTGRAFQDGPSGQVQQLCAPAGVRIGTSSFSYSLWLNAPAVTAGYDMPIYAGGSTAAYAGADLEITPTDWVANIADQNVKGSIPLKTKPTGRWAHVAINVRRNLMEGVSFVDGQKDNTVSLPAFADIMTMALCIGGPEGFGGMVDEVRIYSSSKQEDWFDTEYDNVKNRASFMAIGDEEPATP